MRAIFRNYFRAENSRHAQTQTPITTYTLRHTWAKTCAGAHAKCTQTHVHKCARENIHTRNVHTQTDTQLQHTHTCTWAHTIDDTEEGVAGKSIGRIGRFGWPRGRGNIGEPGPECNFDTTSASALHLMVVMCVPYVMCMSYFLIQDCLVPPTQPA